MLTVFQGEYVRAATYGAEAVALAQDLDDPFLLSQALTMAGLVAYRRGEFDRAEALLDEAARRLSALADRRPHTVIVAGITRLLRGDTALAQEQFAQALDPYEHASELFRSTGDDWRLSDAQAGLGGVSYCTGDFERAAARYAATLERAQQVGYTMIVASSLFGLAGVAAASGRAEEGVASAWRRRGNRRLARIAGLSQRPARSPPGPRRPDGGFGRGAPRRRPRYRPSPHSRPGGCRGTGAFDEAIRSLRAPADGDGTETTGIDRGISSVCPHSSGARGPVPPLPTAHRPGDRGAAVH